MLEYRKARDLGPVLWLVVISVLLMRLTEEEAWVVQAFADDTFVAAKSPAVYPFAAILTPFLAEMHSWATECNL